MIVQNEEEHLGAALASVRPLADEIVVVDSGSRDSTREVARSFGALVIDHEFGGQFSDQRNFALEKVRSPWILTLDADEVVTPDLCEMLKMLAKNGDTDAVFIPRLNLITDEDDRPSSWPDVQVRFFRRGLRFEGSIHEQVVGWSRPVYTPISGPFVIHERSRLRTFKQSLYYASLDSSPYPPEWLEWVRGEVARLEDGADP